MIRRYTKKDKENLIQLLRLNTPEFFHPAEEKEFDHYLEHESQNYFVVEESASIVGAGGFNFGFDEGKTARISWDIIHPYFQGKGIGSELLLFRLDEIRKNKTVNKVIVRTTQLTYRFYQKNGFRLEKIEKDFWAKGFDLYLMTLQ